jgi:hypothetical protein
MGFEDSLPFFGMLMVILIQVGNMEVSKAAMSAGMNKYIYPCCIFQCPPDAHPSPTREKNERLVTH